MTSRILERRYPWFGIAGLIAILLLVAFTGSPGSAAYARVVQERALHLQALERASAAREAAIIAGQIADRRRATDAQILQHEDAVRSLAGAHWLASWATSPQPPVDTTPQSVTGFRDATIREIVFLTSPGAQVRVRFTNRYGARPLVIGRASVAISAGGGNVRAGSVRMLQFGGHGSVTIPPGGTRLSDPVALDVEALQRLAISIYLPHATGPATGHDDAHVNGYVAGGSHVRETSNGPFGTVIGAWYYVDAVDLLSPRRYVGAVAAIGDSITAGVHSTWGTYSSWPDQLARRLAALPGQTLSVLDEGIGGNRVLNSAPCCGASAVSRFDSDVRSQLGVRDVILLEGINDIGYSEQTDRLTAPHTAVSAGQIIAGYRAIIAKAHAAHLRIFGATLLPFEGARYWTAAGEAERETVNAWILHSGAFDGVIDFARIVADGDDQLRLDPRYDSGDHLHPNDRGYDVMAHAISLELLLHG